MSDDIFGQRFYNRSHEPAWHRKGITMMADLSAREALEMLSPPVVTKEPLYIMQGDEPMATGFWHVITRHPTEDDPRYRFWAVGGPDYELVTAQDVARVWDEHVRDPRTGARVPIETMGFLREGAWFFVATKLPAIDVKGDEVEMYLGTVAPLDGRAITTEQWPYRPVCANTLRLAMDNAVERYRIVHDKEALSRMGRWLGQMYARAVDNVAVIKAALEALADVRALEADVEHILRQAYPDPPPVRMDAPDEVLLERAKRREALSNRLSAYRAAARELWEGRGTGMDLPATRGTLYGLWQAVAETECWRRGWNRAGNEDAIVAEQVLIGPRGEAIKRAFSAALELVRQ